jgi:sugar phosphate permease
MDDLTRLLTWRTPALISATSRGMGKESHPMEELTRHHPPHARISGALIAILALMVVSVAINYIDPTSLSTAAPLLSVDLQISPAKMGMLLSTFFWTYATLQLASGWLVDRFGWRVVFIVLGLGSLLWLPAWLKWMPKGHEAT